METQRGVSIRDVGTAAMLARLRGQHSDVRESVQESASARRHSDSSTDARDRRTAAQCHVSTPAAYPRCLGCPFATSTVQQYFFFQGFSLRLALATSRGQGRDDDGAALMVIGHLSPRKRMRGAAHASDRTASTGPPSRETLPQRHARFGNSAPDIPEDVALAVLLHAVASRIDPTGELYMKLCASFQLSTATTSQGHLSPLHSPTAVKADLSSNLPDDEASLSPRVETPGSEGDGTRSHLRWADSNTSGPTSSEVLAHLKAMGQSYLVRSIQERVMSSIPAALTTRRFRPVRWKLGRELGRGAFGRVSMALCQDSGALIAVKTVPLNGPPASVAATVQSLQRELEVLRGVSHPHIVDMLAVHVATSAPAALCDGKADEHAGYAADPAAAPHRPGTVGAETEAVGPIWAGPVGSETCAAPEKTSQWRRGEASPRAAGGGGGLALNIAMEFMEGGSLGKLIEDFGPLPDAVVASYVRQMLLGLEYLHALGVVHADIKPANCLIDKNGLLKLSDFGCAQRLVPQAQAAKREEEGVEGGLGLHVVSSRAKLDQAEDHELSDGAAQAIGALVCVQRGTMDTKKTQWLQPEGTPNYMSAEVVRFRAYSDKSDIWALGLTILECLTGERGFPFSNPQTTLFQVGRGRQPELPAWLGKEATSIVRACLRANPSERPTAAELLSHPFLALAGAGGRSGRGVTGPSAGARAAEVPTALLQLLATLHAHTEGGGQEREGRGSGDSEEWVGASAAIEEIDAPPSAASSRESSTVGEALDGRAAGERREGQGQGLQDPLMVTGSAVIKAVPQDF